MTSDRRFDFKAYVERRKKAGDQASGRGPADYAYEADKRMLAGLGRLVPLRMACEAYLRMYKDLWRGELLGAAVRVGPRQFPELYENVSSCACRLGIPIPEVFVIQHPVMNAFTYGTNDDSFIVVHSASIDHLDTGELRFILGHECGHIQNEHVTYNSVARDLARIGMALMRWVVQPVSMALDAWSRRSEVTADRAGLICCGSPEAAKRALVKFALGSQKLYEQIDLDEFLAQVGGLNETIGRYSELFQGHPYLPKRVKALELFERSVTFRKYADRDGADGGGSGEAEPGRKGGPAGAGSPGGNGRRRAEGGEAGAPGCGANGGRLLGAEELDEEVSKIIKVVG